jgi:3-deoxy-D-manno-octulosonic-acid transferase
VSKLLYVLFTMFYPVAIKLASPFNSKAAAWLKGRRNIFQKMAGVIRTGENLVWMHCSSLGEFEQGRPVLEKLRAEMRSCKILLTFFSPSGYEVRKDYDGADYIFYLPMDSQVNAIRFFDIVQPRLILFVKYEFWNYYLSEAKHRNIPLVLISGIFRKDQPFFKWYGDLHRQMLTCFTHFFVQNQQSATLLKQVGFEKNVTISGDTRFDRVIKVTEEFEPLALIEQFCGAADVVVAGSTWTEDDKELDHFANSNGDIKFIIAPHSVIKDRIDECLHLYKNSMTYSQMQKGIIPAHVNTLIIDNVGMLSRLYSYATICYVGGAFGAEGVHNVLEPAVYGKPVVFGPEYEKYFEAEELVDVGGAIIIENALELEAELKKLLMKDTAYDSACEASKKYVYSKSGSTSQIVQYIYENRLLTS